MPGNGRPEEVGDAMTDGKLTHIVLHGFDRTLCGLKAGGLRPVTEHDWVCPMCPRCAELVRTKGVEP